MTSKTPRTDIEGLVPGDSFVEADYARQLETELTDTQAKLARVVDGGKLWSFFRLLLVQGASIQQDFMAGKYNNFEEYAARVDAAARERVDDFLASLEEGKGTSERRS